MNRSLSDAWRHIERFRDGLIVQLFLRRGPFWEAVKEARRALGVTPERAVPPREYAGEPIKHNDEAIRLYNEQIPEMYRRWFSFDWLGFVDMCIDFDPPGDRLDEFASLCGGPFETRLIPKGRKLGPVGDLPGMVAPPVKRSRAPDGTARFQFAWEDSPSEEDVRRAMGMMRAAAGGKTRPPGHPGRNPLTCIQLAVLYDQRARVPEDPRRWTETYESLGERFGMSPRRVVAHVREGRKILEEQPKLEV